MGPPRRQFLYSATRVIAVAKKMSSKKSGTAKKAVKKTVKKAVKKVAKKKKKKAVIAPVKKAARRKKALKSPLTKAERSKYQVMLLEKRRALISDMSGIEAEAFGGNGSGDLSSMPTHPADIGTDNFEHEFSLGLLESERSLLTEIDTALARIDQGTYGICEGTGKPIGKARLNARPWSKYCIEYTRMVEQGLVRPGLEDEEFDQ